MMAGISFVISAIACLFLAFYLSIYWNIFFVVFYLFRNMYFQLTSLLFSSSLWVILEYIRSYFLTGFPWNLLGYSQWNNILCIQIADITGVYGISFFVIFVNLYILILVDHFIVKNFFIGCRQSSLVKNTIVFISIVLGVFIYGEYKQKIFNFNDYNISGRNLNFCVLQGNIEQYKKFDEQFFENIRNRYTDLINTEMQNNKKIDIFVWPETADPFLYPDNLGYFFKDIKIGANHILGVFNEINGDFYNSAVFLNKDLEELTIYSKMHLVVFGEYFPFKEYIKKIIPIVENLGGIEAGKEYNLFKCEGNLIGVNICFESLFPNLNRKFVKKGANILVNISNDAWYLNTSAPYQHFSFNVLRAVENRRYLVRAANTGISGVISPTGKILYRTGLYEKESFSYAVPGIKYLSFYTRYGDVFVLLCFMFLLVPFLSKSNFKL